MSKNKIKGVELVNIQFFLTGGNWQGVAVSLDHANELIGLWKAGNLPEFVEGIWPEDGGRKVIKTKNIEIIIIRPIETPAK